MRFSMRITVVNTIITSHGIASSEISREIIASRGELMQPQTSIPVGIHPSEPPRSEMVCESEKKDMS